MEQNKILKDLLGHKSGLIELIAVAILIGVGVNFIANSVFAKIAVDHKNLLFFVLGIFFCLLALLYFFIRLFGKKSFKKKIEGFVLLNRKGNTIISVDNYDYLYHLESNMTSAFNEDEALKIDWKNASFKPTSPNEQFKKGLDLIRSASEYYVLEKISTHLTDFFNKPGLDKKQITEYRRDNIPDILLSNRFLELFSKPMEQRAAFKKDSKNEGDLKNVVASYSGGYLFTQFDLVLPNESKITREKDGSILIQTKRLDLIIDIKCAGFNTYVPFEYLNLYLGIKPDDDITALNISFDISVDFKFGSLMRNKGWNYYHWIDSALEMLEDRISQDKYFHKIDWDQTYMILKNLKK